MGAAFGPVRAVSDPHGSVLQCAIPKSRTTLRFQIFGHCLGLAYEVLFLFPSSDFAVNRSEPPPVQDPSASSPEWDCRSSVHSRPPAALERRPRVLLAYGSELVRAAFLPVIRMLSAHREEAASATEFERQLTHGGPFDLVLAESHFDRVSVLGLLTGTRLVGSCVPFILVQSFHGNLMRVLIGGTGRAVLGLRVINEPALFELAQELVDSHNARPMSLEPQALRR